MKPKRISIKLASDEAIVTAFAETHSGPGWGNHTVRVVIRNCAGVYREEYIQPDEMSAQIHALFRIAATVHGEFLAVVKEVVAGRDQ